MARIETYYGKFDTKADIVKVAKLTPHKVRKQHIMHPKEPELSVLWAQGEVTNQQVTAALEAAGLPKGSVNVVQRMGRALQKAFADGLVKAVK